MANKKPKTLQEILRSTTKGASSSNSMRNQVSNYKTRLKSMGIDEDAPVDDRNWLEKLLNLDQNQGFFKDFFELIGRPQQALFTGINEAATGGKFFEGVKEGFLGNEHTYGKDLLETMGMETEDGKWDMADILGFALEVFADPMDIPIIGAANKVRKATKAADAVDDTLGIINKASKAANKTKLISPNQAIFKKIGKGIKTTAKGADNVITKILSSADDKVLKRAAIRSQESGEAISDILKQGGKTYTKLENYNALKKLAKDNSNPSKWINSLASKKRKAVAKSEIASDIAYKKLGNLINKTNDFSRKLMNAVNITDPDEVQKFSKGISEGMFRAIEASQDTAIDGVNFIKNLSTKSNVFRGTNESIDALKRVLDNYEFKYQITKDGLKINKFNGGYNAFKTNKKFLKDIAGLKLNKKLTISPESQKIIDGVNNLAKSNADFANLYKAYKEAYPEVGQVYKEYTGVRMDRITSRPGMVSHIRTPEYAAATEAAKKVPTTKGGYGTNVQKTFASKKYPIAETANIEYADDVNKAVQELPKRIQALKDTNYEGKLEEIENKLNTLFAKTGVTQDKYASKILKKEGKLEKLKQNITNTKNIVTEVSNSLTSDITKKMNNVKDKALTRNMAMSVADYSRDISEYNNLLKKLYADPGNEKISKSLESVSKKIVKNKARMDVNITRLEAYVDDETLKLIKKANASILKTEKTSKLGKKWEDALNMTTEDINVLTQAMDDHMARIQKQIQKTTNEYDALLGKGEKIFEAEKLEKIATLEKQLSFYQEQVGREKLIIDFNESLNGFIKKADEWTAITQTYNMAAADGMLHNPDFIVKSSDVNKVPLGFTQVDSNKFVKNLNAIKEVLPEQRKTINKIIKEYKGQPVYMDKQMANLLNLAGHSKSELQPLLNIIDGLNNTFKTWSVASPGFLIRNGTGSLTNMWLSGMPATKMKKYFNKANSILNDADVLLEKVALEGIDALSDTEKATYNLLIEFREAGFYRIGSKVHDVENLKDILNGKIKNKNLINDYLKWNLEQNERMDMRMRMALFTYAKENPKYISNLGLEDAASAVRYALFDPANLTSFEQNWLKRIIPFYTFTKQNLYFQMTNMMKNTPKYNRLLKGFDAMYRNLDEDEFYQYQKDAMQLPLPWTDDNGNRLFMKLNLPVSDLFEFTDNPVQRIIASTTPLIKAPVELATGVNTFTGQPLYSNAISGLVEALGGQYPQGIKSATQAAEVILTNMGLSNITTNMIKKVAKVIETIKGDATPMELWAEIARSVFQNTNQEKVANSKLYEEMEAYSNYISQLKQQGIEVPTLNEIKLNKLKNKRALYK